MTSKLPNGMFVFHPHLALYPIALDYNVQLKVVESRNSWLEDYSCLQDTLFESDPLDGLCGPYWRNCWGIETETRCRRREEQL